MMKKIVLAALFAPLCSLALPKVMIIGDSISHGYTPYVRQQLAGRAEVVHAPGNSASTQYTAERLDEWLGTNKWQCIHFNWGLHDMKFVDANTNHTSCAKGRQWVPVDQYEKNFESLVGRLEKTGAKLIFATTTPVPQGVYGRIPDHEVIYNAAALRVLKRHPSVSVNDLHDYILPQRSQLGGLKGDVHYTTNAYERLAQHVSWHVEKTLNLPRRDAPAIRVEDSSELQKAIDCQSAKGGGKVILVSGKHLCTGIVLKSGVELVLEEGATLAANPDIAAWKGRPKRSLVYADNETRIAISGKGMLDGGGETFYQENGETSKDAPLHYVCNLRNCKDVSISGVTMRNSIHWTCRIECSEDIAVRDVTIRNPCWAKAHCTDGIDLVCSRNVEIANCDIETGDDAIVLKSRLWKDMRKQDHPVMRNIYVHDCTLASTCNGFKIGTETIGDIERVRGENILVRKHSNAVGKNPVRPNGETISAITVQSNDGAVVRNITFKNINVENCHTPFFAQLQKCDRFGDYGGGAISMVTVDGLDCKRCLGPMQINAMTNMLVGTTVLKNIKIVNDAPKPEKISKTVKRPTGKYPEATANGQMPAYGLFARDVKRLVLENLDLCETNISGLPAIVEESVREH